MKTTTDVVMEQDDLAAIVYEDLIAEIKSTLESPFTSDATKLKYIRQSFRNYDL